LRGIAALSVALGHYGVGDLMDILKVFYWKNAAVDLFFCLSGFTLCVAYKAGSADSLPFQTYLGARIARIYPLYMISLICIVLLHGQQFLGPAERAEGLRDFIQQMLMFNAWPFFGTGIHWLFPAWSVSVEFFCYLLVFPAIFHTAQGLARVDWKARAALAAALMTVSTLAVLRYWGGGDLILGFVRWPGTALPPFLYFVPVIRGILGMLAGCLVYFSYLSRDRFWQLATRWADLLALSAIGILLCGASNVVSNEWMLPFIPALILGFSSNSSLSSRLAASRPIHYLGVISYSIYLLHVPWRLAFGRALDLSPKDETGHPAIFFALLGGLILVAALSYRFAEMPLRNLVRKAFTATASSNRVVSAARWALPAALIVLGLAAAERSGLLGPPPSLPVAMGDDLARAPAFQRVARDGWSISEEWGTWSLGHRSVLVVPLAGSPAAKMKVVIKGVFFVCDGHPFVTAHFLANGVPLGTLTGTPANAAIDQVLDLPPAVFAASPRRLEFVIVVDNPASPSAFGLSDDNRVIGFGLKSMVLVDGGGLP
jgi:peptidoglycan/LPS O-acetylase OafA/YrhL